LLAREQTFEPTLTALGDSVVRTLELLNGPIIREESGRVYEPQPWISHFDLKSANR
jgi:hypothetical protein